MMQMPKLYAAVHQHEDGITVRLFLFSPTKEMPMLAVDELVKHLKIDYQPEKGETLQVCDANDMVNIDEKLGRVDVVMEERKHQYHLNDGAKCLFCLSEAIMGSSFEIDAGLARRDVTCPACGAEWKDIYGLVNVEEISGPTIDY